MGEIMNSKRPDLGILVPLRSLVLSSVLGSFLTVVLVSLSHASSPVTTPELIPAANAKVQLPQEFVQLSQDSDGAQLSKAVESWATSAEQKNQVAKLWRIYGPVVLRLIPAFANAESMARGQVGSREQQRAWLAGLGLSLLRGRYEPDRVALVWHSAWMNFAADLAFEEATAESLRFAHELRQLLLADLQLRWEHLAPGSAHLEWRNYILSFRAQWPVDRVLLLASRSRWAGAYTKHTEDLIRRWQKNHYQSLQGLAPKELPAPLRDHLFKLWTEQDVQLLRAEATRVGLLQARYATAWFVQSNGIPPASWVDLQRVGAIVTVPIDYATGRERVFNPQELLPPGKASQGKEGEVAPKGNPKK